MDNLITLEVLKDFPLAYGITIIIALIPIVLKTIHALISFYEDVLLRRYFNRLKYLSEHVKENSDTFEYLQFLRENEIFRMVSGIKSYPEKSKMFMKIFKLGIADNKELKSIKGYLRPKGSRIEITLNRIDKLHIIYSFFTGLFLMLVGVVIAISLQFESITHSFGGLLIMFIFMFLGGILTTDYRRYRVLARIYKALESQDQLVESYVNISLFNFRKIKP